MTSKLIYAITLNLKASHLLTFVLDASDSVFLSSPLKLLCCLRGCGASVGWVNESLLMGSRSNDQDGRHAIIW